MIIPLAEVTRIVVFVHPGQLESGNIFLVTFHDGYGKEDLDYNLKVFKDAICLYDGPPKN